MVYGLAQFTEGPDGEPGGGGIGKVQKSLWCVGRDQGGTCSAGLENAYISANSLDDQTCHGQV